MNAENENGSGRPAGDAANEEGAAAGEADLAQRAAALEAELAATKDRLLRALADGENMRRRADRDREQERRYAAASFAKDLLNVADNLRRALDSAPEAQDEFTRTLFTGVAATERELLAAFERHGIRRIEPQPGEKFDHHLHQAMFEVDNPGKAPGTIVQILQPGYVMHDRLLRPALVAVAKAAAPPPEDTPHVDTMA